MAQKETPQTHGTDDVTPARAAIHDAMFPGSSASLVETVRTSRFFYGPALEIQQKERQLDRSAESARAQGASRRQIVQAARDLVSIAYEYEWLADGASRLRLSTAVSSSDAASRLKSKSTSTLAKAYETLRTINDVWLLNDDAQHSIYEVYLDIALAYAQSGHKDESLHAYWQALGAQGVLPISILDKKAKLLKYPGYDDNKYRTANNCADTFHFLLAHEDPESTDTRWALCKAGELYTKIDNIRKGTALFDEWQRSLPSDSPFLELPSRVLSDWHTPAPVPDMTWLEKEYKKKSIVDDYQQELERCLEDNPAGSKERAVALSAGKKMVKLFDETWSAHALPPVFNVFEKKSAMTPRLDKLLMRHTDALLECYEKLGDSVADAMQFVYKIRDIYAKSTGDIRSRQYDTHVQERLEEILQNAGSVSSGVEFASVNDMLTLFRLPANYYRYIWVKYTPEAVHEELLDSQARACESTEMYEDAIAYRRKAYDALDNPHSYDGLREIEAITEDMRKNSSPLAEILEYATSAYALEKQLIEEETEEETTLDYWCGDWEDVIRKAEDITELCMQLDDRQTALHYARDCEEWIMKLTAGHTITEGGGDSESTIDGRKRNHYFRCRIKAHRLVESTYETFDMQEELEKAYWSDFEDLTNIYGEYHQFCIDQLHRIVLFCLQQQDAGRDCGDSVTRIADEYYKSYRVCVETYGLCDACAFGIIHRGYKDLISLGAAGKAEAIYVMASEDAYSACLERYGIITAARKAGRDFRNLRDDARLAALGYRVILPRRYYNPDSHSDFEGGIARVKEDYVGDLIQAAHRLINIARRSGDVQKVIQTEHRIGADAKRAGADVSRIALFFERIYGRQVRAGGDKEELADILNHLYSAYCAEYSPAGRKSIGAMNRLAQLYLDAGEADKAVAAYRDGFGKAIETVDDERMKARLQLRLEIIIGDVRAKAKDPRGAVAAYAQAREHAQNQGLYNGRRRAEIERKTTLAMLDAGDSAAVGTFLSLWRTTLETHSVFSDTTLGALDSFARTLCAHGASRQTVFLYRDAARAMSRAADSTPDGDMDFNFARLNAMAGVAEKLARADAVCNDEGTLHDLTALLRSMKRICDAHDYELPENVSRWFAALTAISENGVDTQ